jgi:hypothetical protein
MMWSNKLLTANVTGKSEGETLMPKTSWSRILVLIFLLPGLAMAQNAPSVGLVYNTKEAHSITYSCAAKGGKLECDFLQTAVRRKSNQQDLTSVLAQARQEFRSGQNVDTKECQTYGELMEILEGRKKAPTPNSLATVTPMQKRDILEVTKALIHVCKNKTEENYLAVARLTHSKVMRTCQISTNAFKQTFVSVGDNARTNVWVTDSKPEGACGIVQLSRFTPERSKGSDYVFWKYTAKKAITNPDGIAFPGVNENVKCSGLDEAEYLYDWRSKELPLQCDYIEFSVL